MNRPYIICHMAISTDGKVMGEFLSRPECEKATDIYYELNRNYNKNGASGFICGRVTMESRFIGGWHPDLTKYEPVENKDDFIPDDFLKDRGTVLLSSIRQGDGSSALTMR